jgi:hypothetical protein
MGASVVGETPLGHALMMFAFFLAPVLWLVVGIDYIRRWRISLRHPHRHRPRDAQYWKETKEVWLRAICWFIAAVVCLVVFSIVRNGRWPVPLNR